MYLKRISISIFLILIFSSVILSNDSELDVDEEPDRSYSAFEHQLLNSFPNLNELNNQFEGRAGFNTQTIGAIDSVFGQFWHSLYINRGFNSSFVLLLPLFTITIPGYGRGLQNQTPLSALNIGNLAIFGILVFGTIALWAPILYPDFSFGQTSDTAYRSLNDWENLTEVLAKRLLLLTEQIIGRALEAEDKETKVNNFLISRLHSIVEFLMKYLDKFLADLPEYPGLHPQQCIKRSICESYKNPNSYGKVGKIIRFLFRPQRETTKSEKTVSKYRLAANYGLKDKSIECGHRFNGCELNFLRLIHNAINFLL